MASHLSTDAPLTLDDPIWPDQMVTTVSVYWIPGASEGYFVNVRCLERVSLFTGSLRPPSFGVFWQVLDAGTRPGDRAGLQMFFNCAGPSETNPVSEPVPCAPTVPPVPFQRVTPREVKQWEQANAPDDYFRWRYARAFYAHRFGSEPDPDNEDFQLAPQLSAENALTENDAIWPEQLYTTVVIYWVPDARGGYQVRVDAVVDDVSSPVYRGVRVAALSGKYRTAERARTDRGGFTDVFQHARLLWLMRHDSKDGTFPYRTRRVPCGRGTCPWGARPLA